MPRVGDSGGGRDIVGRPGLPRLRHPRSARPDITVKGQADSSFPGRDAIVDKIGDRAVDRGDQTLNARKSVTAVVNRRIEPRDPALVRPGQIVGHDVDLIELPLHRGQHGEFGRRRISIFGVGGRGHRQQFVRAKPIQGAGR